MRLFPIPIGYGFIFYCFRDSPCYGQVGGFEQESCIAPIICHLPCCFIQMSVHHIVLRHRLFDIRQFEDIGAPIFSVYDCFHH